MNSTFRVNSNPELFKTSLSQMTSDEKGLLKHRIIFNGNQFRFWNASDAFFIGLFFPSLKGKIKEDVSGTSGEYGLRYFWIFKSIWPILIIESLIVLLIGWAISIAISDWLALTAFVVAVLFIDIACLANYKKSISALTDSFKSKLSQIN